MQLVQIFHSNILHVGKNLFIYSCQRDAIVFSFPFSPNLSFKYFACRKKSFHLFLPERCNCFFIPFFTHASFLPMAPKKSFPRNGNPGRLASTIILKFGCMTITSLEAGIPECARKHRRYKKLLIHSYLRVAFLKAF